LRYNFKGAKDLDEQQVAVLRKSFKNTLKLQKQNSI